MGFLFLEGSPPLCTGTLIGCSTLLTAGHCIGFFNKPADFGVFLPHAGLFGVESITLAPGLVDLAVLKLTPQTTGVRPTPINTLAKPAVGSNGYIVGFGSSGGASGPGAGLLRGGAIVTSTCTEVPNPTHICWDFLAPLGSAGVDSGICYGDSGGPLLLASASGDVLGGVTSGINGNISCLPPANAWDADVFVNRSWIQSVAGADLDNTACGAVPQVFDEATAVYTADSRLDATETTEHRFLDLPSGASALRVAVNGDTSTLRDVDLQVRRGAPPTDTLFDCRSATSDPWEYCEIVAPEPGPWWITVTRKIGTGDYQLTATVLGGQAGSSACIPDGSTLCVDDEPGDHRFRVQVFFQTTQGDMPTGFATPIPLSDKGVSAGGLFWFTNPTNPEMLLKVLDGCGSNDHFWIFYAAGTNFAFTTTVTDTKTGRTWARDNPDRQLAPPVADLSALPCE